jgi:Transcription termination factor nusG
VKFPPSMWAHESGPREWYAIQTSEWMEHRVARWLRAMHLFGVYLPTSRERQTDRPVWRRVPIFREYVFLHVGNFGENVRNIMRAGALAVIGPISEVEMDAVRWLEFELNRPGVPTRRRRGWRRRRLTVGANQSSNSATVSGLERL